uniref:Integrase zinc-binding domain-containing protein n=1 Tax=Panagrolaimus sp. PS1159 TaxID=55785 RepID=A0AC35FZT8_9BILA
MAATGTKDTLTLQNVETIREYEIDTNLSWTDFKKKIAMKIRNIENEHDLLPQDLLEAENLLIKQEQKFYTTSEIKKHLKLAKNGFGIYCIQTRFDHADLINPHPIFLSKSSPITKTIVMDTHEKLHHSGIPHTLSKIRETYWITCGRITVQKTLQKCKVCKIWKGKPFALPNMSQLPSSSKSLYMLYGINF